MDFIDRLCYRLEYEWETSMFEICSFFAASSIFEVLYSNTGSLNLLILILWSFSLLYVIKHLP